MRALTIITLVIGTTFVGSVATASDASAVAGNAGVGGSFASETTVNIASAHSTADMSAVFSL